MRCNRHTSLFRSQATAKSFCRFEPPVSHSLLQLRPINIGRFFAHSDRSFAYPIPIQKSLSPSEGRLSYLRNNMVYFLLTLLKPKVFVASSEVEVVVWVLSFVSTALKLNFAM